VNNRSPVDTADIEADLSRRQELEQWLIDGSALRWRKAWGRRSDAARRLGNSERQVLRWETGEVYPNLGNWRRCWGFYSSIRPKEGSCPQPPTG
jgi:hypothetical protein